MYSYIFCLEEKKCTRTFLIKLKRSGKLKQKVTRVREERVRCAIRKTKVGTREKRKWVQILETWLVRLGKMM